MSIEKVCTVCGKPISYERHATEVSCPFCYTDFKLVKGRLVESDGLGGGGLGDDEGPLAIESVPARQSGPKKDDLSRLLDDGADQHLTFVKDNGADSVRAAIAKAGKSKGRPKSSPGRPKSDVAPASPAKKSSGFEFADDDDEPAPRPAAPLPAAHADSRVATPAVTADASAGKKKKKKRKKDAVDYSQTPEGIVGAPEDDDVGQKWLVAAVLVFVGILLLVGLSAVAVMFVGILDGGSGGPVANGSGDGDGNGDESGANGTTTGNSDSATITGETATLDAILTRAEEALQAGSYADACESVLLLETALKAPDLDRRAKSRIETVLRDAVRIRDGYRMLKQANRAIERVSQAESPYRRDFEGFFAGEMLGHARVNTTGGKNFSKIKDDTHATTALLGQ